MFKKIIFWTVSLMLYTHASEYTAYMAQNHIGEKATVCGKVVSTYYASNSKGEPTFLNLEEPYPDHIFTVVIWGDERERFGEPETIYKNKHICITGKIKSYRGKAEIIAYSPSQISIK